MRDEIQADKDVPEKFKQIPRFPSNLRRIGRERDYIAPRIMAIGPYYHGVVELQPMEEVKHKFANFFFGGLAQSQEAIKEEIKSRANSLRCYYTDKFALQRFIDNDKFAEIMFIDGCFLVQFFSGLNDKLRSLIQSNRNGIYRDIMLLENQIPWAVMEVLMPLKGLEMEDIIRSLVPILHGHHHLWKKAEKFPDYKPSHLLCLIQLFEADANKNSHTLTYTSTDHNPQQSVQSTTSTLMGGPRAAGCSHEPAAEDPNLPFIPRVCTSAVELAEIGIKLEASQEKKLSAMDIRKGCFSAKLVLAPLQICGYVHCWLVNLAAFEMWAMKSQDNFSVNSYLSILSSLMNREEDVHQLRVKLILSGTSSDRQTLEFFNDLGPDLYDGNAYWQLLGKLEEYKKKRWMRIAIYRFFYKYAKVIATVLSILGVLVGIFKAILSLKQPPAHY